MLNPYKKVREYYSHLRPKDQAFISLDIKESFENGMKVGYAAAMNKKGKKKSPR